MSNWEPGRDGSGVVPDVFDAADIDMLDSTGDEDGETESGSSCRGHKREPSSGTVVETAHLASRLPLLLAEGEALDDEALVEVAV